MLKTLVVGDIHCKTALILPRVDSAIIKFGIESVVFCGDYVDERYMQEADMLDSLLELIAWRKRAMNKGIKVHFLVGNHDFEYILDSKFPILCADIVFDVCGRLDALKLEGAFLVDGWLVTHAGLTKSWASEYIPDACDAESALKAINTLFKSGDISDLIHLSECGPGRGGKGVPGPLWTDRRELMSDGYPGLRQIVGHSPVKSCLHFESEEDELWFVDTFTRDKKMRAFGDGSMLLVGDGEVFIVEGKDLRGLPTWKEIAPTIGSVEIAFSEEE